MKIAILVPNFSEYSGDSRVAELQAEELIKEGNDVVIFALWGNNKPKTAKLRVMGMPKSLFWQRVYRLIFPCDLIKIFKWLPKLKDFDLIIAHLYPMTVLAFLAKKFYGVKYTFWNHGVVSPDLFTKLHEKVYLKMNKFLTKVTTRNADRVVSVSEYLREEFKSYTGMDSEVIYNTIDRHRFHQGISGIRVRQKYNLGDAPMILSVGRLSPSKGFHLLIKAFDLVKQRIPETKLVIVGQFTYDQYSEQLKEMIDNSVIVTGYVEDNDLPYYYAACDIYATCTLWEGFNLPLVEAQACGKPVVAFNMGPHPEVINENGVLVETGDIEGFAQACIDKINQVRQGTYRGERD